MSTTNGQEEGVVEGAAQAKGKRARRRAVREVAPLARDTSRTAEDAQLRSRIETARILGDAVEEQQCARTLAERLAFRAVELDLAIEYARRSLQVEADPTLRTLLAGWLEGLGQPALAASELRKLVDPASPEEACPML